MAHNYTKEAGVRQLERKIGDICRKAAKELLMTEKEKIAVTDRNLSQIILEKKSIRIRWQMQHRRSELCVDLHGQV